MGCLMYQQGISYITLTEVYSLYVKEIQQWINDHEVTNFTMYCIICGWVGKDWNSFLKMWQTCHLEDDNVQGWNTVLQGARVVRWFCVEYESGFQRVEE